MLQCVARLTGAKIAFWPRIVDAQFEKYLQLFGAVEISGTKWCGKHGLRLTVRLRLRMPIVALIRKYQLLTRPILS